MKKIDVNKINDETIKKHQEYYEELPNKYKYNLKNKDLELLFIKNPFDFSNTNPPYEKYRYLKKSYWKFIRYNEIKRKQNRLDEIIDLTECYANFRTPDKARKRNKYWNGIKLIERLDTKICPYCGMSYITTVTKKNGKVKTEATLDHYLPKSKYPFLAMNIYNLVPSCRSCNLVFKFQENDAVIYPFEEALEDLILFDFENRDCVINSILDGQVDKPAKIKIYMKKPSNRLRKHIQSLLLEERYNEFQNIAKSIILKRHIYNESQLKNFEKLGIYSKAQFTNALLKQDVLSNDEIFSKFKKDIWKELKI